MQVCPRASAKRLIAGSVVFLMAAPAMGLPPADDLPEEVLRTEIITEARSPIDGQPLSAADYAELQAQLQDPNDRQSTSADLREIIFLLELRRGLRTILPIIP